MKNFKLWNKYEWAKNLLSNPLFCIGIFLLCVLLLVVFFKLNIFWNIFFIPLLLFVLFVFAVVLRYLKNYRIPYIFIILLCLLSISFKSCDGYWWDSDDYDYQAYKECVAKKIEKGYPESFARDYCEHIKYCIKKEYEENCNPEIYCCFMTIEEDKKWNYLDYDEIN